MDEATRTPVELARELSVDPRQIRAYLRSVYGTLPPSETRWHLNATQVAEVCQRFA